jgi:YD repeat-containing protein
MGWRSGITRGIAILNGVPLNITQVSVTRPGQREYIFTKNNGIWSSDADVKDTLTQLTDANGITTGWTYLNSDGELERFNASGGLTSITDRHGLTITLSILADGVRFTDPVGRSITTSNDIANGYINQFLDYAGQAYVYGRDSSGRLSSVTYPDGKQRFYLYETRTAWSPRSPTTSGSASPAAARPARPPASSTTRWGASRAYTLDAAGNRTREEVFDPQGALAKTLTRAYDALGRMQTLTGVGNE